MKFFPYGFRKYQDEIVKFVEEAITKKDHVILEAPTGIGKTIAVLAPSLEYAVENNLKVFYLTRTNSQQEQVIKEAKLLRKNYEFGSVSLQGRNNYCLLMMKEKIIDATPEEFALLCEKKKKDVENGKYDSCIFYNNYLEKGEELLNFGKRNVFTAQEFIDRALEDEICAYEAIKNLTKDASLIVMPYMYFFDPFIRSRLLDWSNTNLDEIILIVDEAHNLPDFARSLRSLSLSIRSINATDREVREFGEINYKNIKLSYFLETLREVISYFENETLKDREDSPISHSLFLDMLAEKLNSSRDDVIVFLNNLVAFGEYIRNKKLNQGALPRSYVWNLSNFLLEFFENDSKDTVRLITKEDVLRLELFSIDPKPITSVVEKVHSSIHMSGTLRPLDEYESLVFENVRPKKASYPSPFPPENLKVYYIDNVTTKYEIIERNGEESKKIAGILEKILSKGHNSLVLFPSYRIMEKILNEDIIVNGEIFIERQNITQSEFTRYMHLFKRHGGTFFSVFGSRISEGIDFPENILEMVVIVGIPYPKPTARQELMEMYYRNELGKEKVYRFLVHGPAGRKIVQAFGRMIRSSKDRGIGIILDERAHRFRDFINMEKSKNIEEEIDNFFKVKEINNKN